MRCGLFVGYTPRYGHKSEPQTQLATTRTMASVGFCIFGSVTFSMRISRGPWINVAFILNYLHFVNRSTCLSYFWSALVSRFPELPNFYFFSHFEHGNARRPERS